VYIQVLAEEVKEVCLRSLKIGRSIFCYYQKRKFMSLEELKFIALLLWLLMNLTDYSHHMVQAVHIS
jgi:hypothetical protein